MHCGVGGTESFSVKVGLHQGSVLSPFLFALVVDTISEGARTLLPKDLPLADDLVIVAERVKKSCKKEQYNGRKT